MGEDWRGDAASSNASPASSTTSIRKQVAHHRQVLLGVPVIHPRLAARQVPPHHAHPGTPPRWEEQSRHKHVILCKTNCEGRAGRPISVGSAAGEVSCPLRAGVASVYFITTTRAGLLHGAGTMLRQVQNAQMQMIIKQRFENVPGRAAAGRGCRG